MINTNLGHKIVLIQLPNGKSPMRLLKYIITTANLSHTEMLEKPIDPNIVIYRRPTANNQFGEVFNKAQELGDAATFVSFAFAKSCPLSTHNAKKNMRKKAGKLSNKAKNSRVLQIGRLVASEYLKKCSEKRLSAARLKTVLSKDPLYLSNLNQQ